MEVILFRLQNLKSLSGKTRNKAPDSAKAKYSIGGNDHDHHCIAKFLDWFIVVVALGYFRASLGYRWRAAGCRFDRLCVRRRRRLDCC
jgi:hypothetical protein